MPKVFVIQEPIPNKHAWVPDLSLLSGYGSIHYLLDKIDKPWKDPEAAREKVKHRLEIEEPIWAQDYLCWPNAGDIVSVYVTCDACLHFHLLRTTPPLMVWFWD